MIIEEIMTLKMMMMMMTMMMMMMIMDQMIDKPTDILTNSVIIRDQILSVLSDRPLPIDFHVSATFSV